jgi:hypothetical protein
VWNGWTFSLRCNCLKLTSFLVVADISQLGCFLQDCQKSKKARDSAPGPGHVFNGAKIR